MGYFSLTEAVIYCFPPVGRCLNTKETLEQICFVRFLLLEPLYCIPTLWILPAPLYELFEVRQCLIDLWALTALLGARQKEGALFMFDEQMSVQWLQRTEAQQLAFPVQKFLFIAICVVLFGMHSVKRMVHEGQMKKVCANSWGESHSAVHSFLKGGSLSLNWVRLSKGISPPK